MFYDQFYKLCRESRVTPTQVARDLDIRQSTVSMWKKQGTTPKYPTLQKIADYFDVSVDYLLSAEEEHGKQHLKDSLRVAVVCAIPTRYHSEIFQKIREIGIPMEKIVRESKYGAFIGEGFIVEELTTEEQIRVENAIHEVLFRYMPHQAPSEATAAPESPQIPQGGKDTTPDKEPPETPPEGE